MSGLFDDVALPAAAGEGEPPAGPAPEPPAEEPAVVDLPVGAQLEKVDAGDMAKGLAALDVDELDRATRGLDLALQVHIAAAAAAHRRQRAEQIGDRPLEDTDVYELIRRLQHSAEVLGRIARDVSAAAAYCAEEIQTEALAVNADRLAVPDGETDIIIAPGERRTNVVDAPMLRDLVVGTMQEDYRQTFDTDALAGLLADAGDRLPDVVADLLAETYQAGSRAGWDQLLTFGTASWRVTDIKAFAAQLAAAKQDDAAGAVKRTISPVVERTEKLTVKREAFKPTRRSGR